MNQREMTAAIRNGVVQGMIIFTLICAALYAGAWGLMAIEAHGKAVADRQMELEKIFPSDRPKQ